MILLLFISFFNFTQSTYVISVYGDVYRDKAFFNSTFPWIIDNVGGEIMVDFYMLGSGRYTVPQMCALAEMRSNTFLQAQYLKCEAEGNPSEYCLCETGIDPQRFRQCVVSKGSLAATASAKFRQVGVDVTPLIELGPKNTVFMVGDSWYLKKICTIFGDNLPLGCVKPFSCNGTETLHGSKALAQFDKCCGGCEKDSWATTSTTASSPYDESYYFESK